MKYIDRQGNKTESDSGQDRFLKRLYTSAAGRMALKIMVRPWVSKAGGKLLNTRLSALFIDPFVKKNQIDMKQYVRKRYSSYNEFFCRQIRPDMRPIDRETGVLISPCDGKLSVYPVDEQSHFLIKYTEYTLPQMLKSRRFTGMFRGGYACVFRLTVDDYHRYCYVADGIKSPGRFLPGVLHTVNPAAGDVYPIYKENAREYCMLKTKEFGPVLMMEVGAMMVGRIVNTPGRATVKKGQEKGHFEFGGSTIVVLLQKDRVRLDANLLGNTRGGYETVVKMGERIGIAMKAQQNRPAED